MERLYRNERNKLLNDLVTLFVAGRLAEADRVLATKPHDGLSINRITGVGDGDDFSTKGILRLG